MIVLWGTEQVGWLIDLGLSGKASLILWHLSLQAALNPGKVGKVVLEGVCWARGRPVEAP